ncbi:MAG TPA: hypothetical protein VNG90_04035 [Candidatus Acidoferrum sp.]|nr:hypothetical protein [Candidatus Acidoferrum sp.]
MYGKGGASLISSATVTTAGIIVLPNTSGNILGTILAYSAIAIGGAVLLSQVAVRVVRHFSRG